MKKILFTVFAVVLSFNSYAGEFDAYLKELEGCRQMYQKSQIDHKLKGSNYHEYSQEMLDKGLEAAECYKKVGYKVIEKFYGEDAVLLKESLNKITSKLTTQDSKPCRGEDCKKGLSNLSVEEISEQIASLVEKLIKSAEFFSKKG